MLQKLLIMYGFGSVDGALAGLESSMRDLNRVAAHKITEAEVADAQVSAQMVRRDEASGEAARAQRVLGKLESLLS